MRVGRGGITLVGLFFMVGVAFLSLGPKMPSDPKSPCIVGGRLSHPFRRALLALVILAISRDLIFGLLLDNESSSALLKFSDSFLGTIFTVGQAFLCVSSAYLLQCQLSNVINVHPGEGLSPYLIAVLIINLVAYTLSYWSHPNYIALISLGSAVSTIPVIKTLRLYAQVTTYGGAHAGRGTVLTQVMTHSEYWYIFSSLVAFLAEMFQRENAVADGTDRRMMWRDDLVDAMRHHQDVGVDDWTRLLVHSIYLNLVDELMHVSPSSTNNNSAAGDAENGEGARVATLSEEVQIVKPLVKHGVSY
jgi:hypothetical protein